MAKESKPLNLRNCTEETCGLAAVISERLEGLKNTINEKIKGVNGRIYLLLFFISVSGFFSFNAKADSKTNKATIESNEKRITKLEKHVEDSETANKQIEELYNKFIEPKKGKN